jgi:hypothetical protein
VSMRAGERRVVTPLQAGVARVCVCVCVIAWHGVTVTVLQHELLLSCLHANTASTHLPTTPNPEPWRSSSPPSLLPGVAPSHRPAAACRAGSAAGTSCDLN